MQFTEKRIRDNQVFCFILGKTASPLEACASSLFIVLKDHKSAEAITLTRESQRQGIIVLCI